MKIFEKIFDYFWRIPDDHIDIKHSEKILVVGVGAGLSKDLNCSPQTKAVVEIVLAIALENKLTDIFFSGGYEINGHYEALEMKHYFYQVFGDLAQKFPNLVKSFTPFFITIETNSKNTKGNVQEIVNYARKKKYEKVIVIDFYGHLKQLKSLFKKELKKHPLISCSFYFINAPAPFGGNIQKRLNHPLLFFIWEALTTLYYFFEEVSCE